VSQDPSGARPPLVSGCLAELPTLPEAIRQISELHFRERATAQWFAAARLKSGLKVSRVVRCLIKEKLTLTQEDERGLIECFPDSQGLRNLNEVLILFRDRAPEDTRQFVPLDRDRDLVVSVHAAFIGILDDNGECLGKTARWPKRTPPVRPDLWSVFAPFLIVKERSKPFACRLNNSFSEDDYFRGLTSLSALLDAMRARPADVVRPPRYGRDCQPVILPVGQPDDGSRLPPPLSADVQNGTLTWGKMVYRLKPKDAAFFFHLIAAEGKTMSFSAIQAKPTITPESSLEKS